MKPWQMCHIIRRDTAARAGAALSRPIDPLAAAVWWTRSESEERPVLLSSERGNMSVTVSGSQLSVAQACLDLRCQTPFVALCAAL